MMQSDEGNRGSVIGRRKARGARTVPGIAGRSVWKSVSPLLPLSASLPVWALDGRCGGPVSFWNALLRVFPVAAVLGLVAGIIAALLGLLLRLGVRKLLRRELSRRRCILIPAITTGVCTFVVAFFYLWALVNACF